MREELRELADQVPEAKLPQAVRLLRNLAEQKSLRELLDEAPFSDEPLTQNELEAIEEGEADYQAGRTVSSSEVRARLRPPTPNT
jgi:predicted transcriptional regulator